MQQQLQAGYVIDVVSAWLQKQESDLDWRDVFRYLATFEIYTDDIWPAASSDSIVAVVDNLISRGLPTRCSCFIEDVFAEILGCTRLRDDEAVRRTGSIQYDWTDEGHAVYQLLARAAAIIDPRVTPDTILPAFDYTTWELHGSSYEEQFHLNILSELVGPFAFQLVLPQRELRSIISRDVIFGEKNPELERLFFKQRVDFAIELPRAKKHKRGLIIEIDGTQHADNVQRRVDNKRDRESKSAGWDSVRILTDEIRQAVDPSKRERLQAWFAHPYARLIAENYENPLWQDPDGLVALQLVLSPIAIARIQKVLTRLIRANILSLNAPVWRIAVIERDVPCAQLAIQDFEQLLFHLFELEGRERKLPEIELHVYYTQEFGNAALSSEKARVLTDSTPPFHADVLIDISVLRRAGYDTKDTQQNTITADHIIYVRSTHAPKSSRSVTCAPPVKYDLEEFERSESLLYFLQNIFRKQSFREGQVPILRRILTRKSVIALLPTGAGKSLTYQLGALLQPGITLVVDPIKSLMKDQDDNLRRARIDSTVFINSSLQTHARRFAESQLIQGKYQFAFVSPERLMIAEFRQKLEQMADAWFSHCVVDEAHCVSEWGHDFRTLYLRLGQNARKHCYTGPSSVPLPIIALTGTASYDVLEDVQRELEFNPNDTEAIITPGEYKRDELIFSVVPVDCSHVSNQDDRITILEQVAEKKRAVLKQVLESMPERFSSESCESFYELNGPLTNAGIVFAPHRTWKFGVTDLSAAVKADLPVLIGKTDFYAGSDDNIDFDADRLEMVQQKFKNDELCLLVATKAFGMGIDKPNIRYTIHFNMPQSLESFYQEAGRAGRDRLPSHCLILHSDQKLIVKPSDGSNTPVSVDQELMLSFFRNSFRGPDHEWMCLEEILRAAHPDSNGKWTGIENVLDDLRIGETVENIPVAFQNDKIEHLRYVLRKRTKGLFSNKMIKDAYGYCYSFEEFLENLITDVERRKFPVTRDELMDLREEIRPLYDTIRNEQATFKAIYRLSVIGVIDDYRLDYGKKVIYADVRKRADDEYIRLLQQYIGRYVSKEDADRVPAEVNARNERTTLHRCLGRLIDFVYERIASKRLQAIRNMEDAINAGKLRPEEQYEDAQKRFAEHVYTFFDSRYIPLLRPHLKNGYDIALAWEFIARTEGLPNELKHLRGACERLLEVNSEHAGLLLMRAFSLFMLPEERKDRAREDFRKAWRLLRERKSWTWTDFISEVSTFCSWIEKYDPDATSEIADEIGALHTEWIQSFLKENQLQNVYG